MKDVIELTCNVMLMVKHLEMMGGREMNEIINYKDFQKVLEKNNSPEACQYLESLWDAYTAYMPISFRIAEKMAEMIVQGEVEFADKMNDEINKQLAHGSSSAHYRPKISDLPRNICNFEGLDIPSEMLFRKSIYDFFHWSRMCLELPLQLINAAFGGDNKESPESVRLYKVKELLKSEVKFQKLLGMINSATGSDEYKYTCDFDNCMKHIKLVPIKVIAVQMSFGSQPPPLTPKFAIEAFSHNNHSYDKVNALEKIDKVEEFVRVTIYQIFLEIQNIIAAAC